MWCRSQVRCVPHEKYMFERVGAVRGSLKMVSISRACHSDPRIVPQSLSVFAQRKQLKQRDFAKEHQQKQPILHFGEETGQ